MSLDRVEKQMQNINRQLNDVTEILNPSESQDGQEWSFKDKTRVRIVPRHETTMDSDKTPPRNESTPQTPSDPIAEAAARIARTLAITLESTFKQQPRAASCPLPEYHGHDYEDPRNFALKLNRHFVQAQISDEYEKVVIASRQLRGEAARWYSLYRDLPLDYASFLQRLNHKFNSTSVLATARSKLYGEAQGAGEPVALFVTRKRTLFARLDPLIPEGVMIDTIIEQLLPETRSRLRAYTFHNIEDLLNVTTQIEGDLSVINKNARAAAPANRPLNHVQNQAGPSTRAPATCRRCNHAHLYVDCPLRQQENARRVDPPADAEQQRGPRSAQ